MSFTVFAPLCKPRHLHPSLCLQLQCLKPAIPARTFKGRSSHPNLRAVGKIETLKDINYTLFKDITTKMPSYPHGLQSWGNAYQPHPLADKALLGGAQIQSGNKISKGRNKGKTRRTWLPYIRSFKIKSECLGDLTIMATRRCMRTIEKSGGLDQYLLGEKPARLKELGPFGWKLRWLVMNSPSMKEKLEIERIELGLPEADSFEAALAKPEIRDELLRAQSEAWQKLREKDARFEKLVESQWKRADKVDDYKPHTMLTLRNTDPATIDLTEALEAMKLEEERGENQGQFQQKKARRSLFDASQPGIEQHMVLSDQINAADGTRQIHAP